MTIFAILAGLMIIFALSLILVPLLGSRNVQQVDRKALNTNLIREQFQQLESDFQNGRVAEAQYAEARQELEHAIIRNDKIVDARLGHKSGNTKLVALALVALLPLLSVLAYKRLGAPDLLHNPPVTAASSQMDVEAMVAGLAARLESSPDDVEGWTMLGKSYMVMRRFSDAKSVYQKLLAKDPENTALLLSYADATVMLANGDFSGEPLEIIQKILTIDPTHIQARWMAGLAAQQSNDTAGAMEIWQPLLTELQQLNPELAAELSRTMAATGKQTGANEQSTPKASEARISVKVAIDGSILSRISPTDTVFIYARAMQGPPMPLAIQRYAVADIPAVIVLDDSTAMMPQMKLSNFETVKIDARISKTGSATPQAGDFFGRVENVSTAKRDVVQIQIGQVVE